MTRLADPSAAERELKLKLRLAQLQANEACRDDFLTFVRRRFGRISLRVGITRSLLRSWSVLRVVS
jgi:hypothetical protein